MQTGPNFVNVKKGLGFNNKEINLTNTDDISGVDSRPVIPPAPPLPTSATLAPQPPINQIILSPSTNNSSIPSIATSTQKSVGAREDLMDAIKSFQGFSNKGAANQQNRVSDPPPHDCTPSILDQLKNELIKRAQYLSNIIVYKFNFLFKINF
jgi:hypothetical protein